jgi:iron complex outermembrane receptor protein
VAVGCLLALMMTGFMPNPAVSASAPESSGGKLDLAQAQRYRVDVSMMVLGGALRELARQMGLQFARFSDVAPVTVVVGPLSGTYTRAQALDLLLHDTGLTYRFINADTVAIIAASNATSAQSRPRALPQRVPPRPVAPAPAAARGASAAARSAAAAAAGRGASAGALQEVVVTAERRATDVQATPIAMTAMTGDALRAAHVDTVMDLQLVAPIDVSSSGWHQQINIRGIGNSVISAAVNTGVAVIRDGLFEAETLGQNEPLYDIQDVEVLRGPQGTFVGYSSTGGAVEINSVNPDFNGLSGYVEGQLGDYSDRKLQGAVNLQANDFLALRIAANDERRNSFYGHTAGPGASGRASVPGAIDDREMRISLLWRPAANFQVLSKLAYDSERTGGLPSQVNQGTFTDPISGAVAHVPYYANSTHQPFLLNTDRDDAAFDTLKLEQGLELRYTLPGGTVLRSQSGFERIDTNLVQDLDATSLPAQWQFRRVGPSDNYYSQELNLLSPASGALTWIAGAVWFYRDTPVYSSTYNAAAPYSLSAAQTSVATTGSVQRIAGLFGQASWQLTDTLQLQAGLRENWDNNFNYGSTVTYNPLTGLSRTAPNMGYYSDQVPTGKVDLNWTALPGQYFYLFYARGYKSGGINNGSSNFNPEHVDDYEFGWKGRLLGGHMLTQVGGYWMRYQEYQYSTLYPPTGRLNVTNLPTATIKGIEASMQARLGGLGVDLGVYLNESVLGALTTVATYKLPPSLPTNTPQCAAGQTLNCFDYAPYQEDVSGEANAFSPKLTINAAVEYEFPLSVGALVPRVTYSHVDKQYASIFQTDTFFLMPPRNLLGADLQYRIGPWLADLYGTNLTNDIYVSGFYGSASNLYDVFYGSPRQIGMRFSRRF